jgi:hypothetical protein
MTATIIEFIPNSTPVVTNHTHGVVVNLQVKRDALLIKQRNEKIQHEIGSIRQYFHDWFGYYPLA